jgi:hypothetical protein
MTQHWLRQQALGDPGGGAGGGGAAQQLQAVQQLWERGGRGG